MIPQFLLNFGVLLGDVMYDLLSQSISLEPIKLDCNPTIENNDNGTDLPFQKSLEKLVEQHRTLGYDSSDNLVYYKSAMDIFIANQSETKKLGTWNTEKGFSLVPGQVMKPDKRFFRIGIIAHVSINCR